ncbi:MAG: hypothetical protein IKF17_05745 [Clostridia bacterium]|nr:hypothetical protein [Clostridia bacterium]
MEEQNKLTTIFAQYQKIKDYLTSKGYFSQLEKNYNFFMGDQWKGLESGDQPMPVDNIIASICNYKIGNVNQNNMTIVYSSENVDEEDFKEFEYTDETGEVLTTSKRKIYEKAVELLNKNANTFFESNNLETEIWDYNTENCISGMVCMYIYKDENDLERAEMVEGNNIYFADENDPEIQNQEFILITFRRPVEQVREEARRNGLSEDEIQQITADNDTDEQIGNKKETEVGSGKVLCILKLYKKTKKVKKTEKRTIQDENGNEIEVEVEVGAETRTTVHMVKSTKNVVYVKETDLGLTLYPLSKMIWIREKNNARGRGEPQDKIPNQIEINQTLARRDIAIQMSAYPKLAYLRKRIQNPGSLNKVGVAIAVEGEAVQDIRNAIDYLNPTQVSPDAKNFSDELSSKTKDNASASDAALGTIDPEKASGRSVIAVRDAAAVPLNIHVARYKMFFEDIARILFDFWQNVDVEGKRIIIEETDEETGKTNVSVEVIPHDVMTQLKIKVKVNVAQTDPYSIYAQEEMWDNLFVRQAITFEEWVDGLSDNSKYNKAKLEEIVRNRRNKERQLMNIEEDIKNKQIEADGIIQQRQQEQEVEDTANEVEAQQEELNQMIQEAQQEEEFNQLMGG